MQVTEVRLQKAAPEDSCLAYGSITFDGDFVVSGIRVLRTKDGNLFVGFPSKKNSRGEYKDICVLSGSHIFGSRKRRNHRNSIVFHTQENV